MSKQISLSFIYLFVGILTSDDILIEISKIIKGKKCLREFLLNSIEWIHDGRVKDSIDFEKTLDKSLREFLFGNFQIGSAS